MEGEEEERKEGGIIRSIIVDVSFEFHEKEFERGGNILEKRDKEQVSSDLFPGKNFITGGVSI